MSTIALHLDKPFGFTCQTWLATDIADRHFGSVYRVWFATSINPPRNGSSSNPLIIYQELERVIDTNDLNHCRIEQLRLRLSNWIHGQKRRLSKKTRDDLVIEISSAPVRAFRPSIWKIDLATIDVRRFDRLGQFPDEYLVADIVPHEFEVVTP